MTGNIDIDIEIARERLRLAKPQAPATPEIDTRTGAPWSVRTTVGAAVKPEDRLATLQKFYPDARPEGTDNFIYTDPKTGKPTLYNEKGFSLGDMSSLLPEVGEFVGGMVGGGMGVAAMPATGGASVLTVPMMTGLGAVTGRKMAETGAQYILGTEDTRTVPEHLADDALTTGVNAVAGPAFDTAARGVRAFIGPKVQPAVKEAFERANVHPMAGAVTGSQMVQSAEHAAFNTPGGTRTMQTAFEKTTEDVSNAASQVTDSIRTTTNPNQKPKSLEEAGAVLKSGVSKAGDRFAKTRQDLDDFTVNAVGATRPTQLTETRAYLAQLQAELARAPNSRPELKRAIAEAQRLITDADASGGAIPFDVLRKVRTRIGQELEQPDASGYLPGESRSMADLYGKLKDDVYGAAREADAATVAAGGQPTAVRALDMHDRYVTMFRGDKAGRIPPAETFTKVLQQGSDAKAMQYAMEGSEQSTQRLWQLRRSLKPEEWDVVASSIFEQLGRAKPGAQGGSMLGDTASDFSIGTFLTNWEKLGVGKAGRTSRDVLFGGSQYSHVRGAINDLVTVVQALKGSQKLANTSGTARSTAWHSLFGALGGGLVGVTSGSALAGVGAAAGTAGGTMAVGYGAARLLTSKNFVRWLTNSARAIGTDPNAMGPALARLEMIADREPELRDTIQQYREQLQNSMTPPAATTP